MQNVLETNTYLNDAIHNISQKYSTWSCFVGILLGSFIMIQILKKNSDQKAWLLSVSQNIFTECFSKMSPKISWFSRILLWFSLN